MYTQTSYGFTLNNQASEPLIIKAHFLSKKQAEVHQHIHPNQTRNQYEATYWQKQRPLKVMVCYPTAKSTDQKPICDTTKPMVTKVCNAHKAITISKKPCPKHTASCQQTLELSC